MRGAAPMLAGILVLAFACPVVLCAAEDQELIAVLDLQPVSARKAEASALTDRLREELLKTGRYTLVDRSQIDAVLNEQAFQQAGCTEQECAVQAGRILGVRKLVVGRVTKLSDRLWLVSGIIVDVESARTLRAESVQHQGELVGLMQSGISILAHKLAGVQGSITIPPSLKSGDVWREPITGLEFVRIPGGTYEQGCHAQAGECFDNEKPARRVTLSPFWLGKTEVTQAKWQRIMDSNPSSFKGDDRPVERVSWNDAQEFIRRLNAQSRGVTFRLPTEAEWEYACRAGGGSVIYGTASGDVSRGNANYANHERGTTPVTRYAPNALGLHDMTGNVLEWVQDVFDKDAYRGGTVGNLVNARSSDYRVRRGGGWSNHPRNIRCSVRNGFDPGNHYDDLGFRLARTE
jgi:formylglycine-generating enzyme required for sulfatase activity